MLFDLNNRNSFDNLNEYWLKFLRDDCYCENVIYVLGNYFDKTCPPLTQLCEITDMITKSETRANYIEIGNLSKKEMKDLIDELIKQSYNDEIKNMKVNDCKQDSFKKCLLF